MVGGIATLIRGLAATDGPGGAVRLEVAAGKTGIPAEVVAEVVAKVMRSFVVEMADAILFLRICLLQLHL